MNKSISTNTFLILLGTILVWGLSWPSSKAALNDISPFWFVGLRLLGGCIVMFAIAFAIKRLRLPKREDWPLILSVGIFQIGTVMAFGHLGLQYMEAGRSSILIFTAMIWVTPVAMLLGERMNPMKIVGFILGVCGILLLFNPMSIDWGNRDLIFGNAMILLASMCWAVAILHIRFAKWHSEPIELLPWQLVIGTVPVIILALIKEPFSAVHFTTSSVSHLAYNAIFASGLAYWGALEVGRRLPATTISLAFLGVPVIGYLSSILFLGEAFTLNTAIALGLLLGGLGSMAFSDRSLALPVDLDVAAESAS